MIILNLETTFLEAFVLFRSRKHTYIILTPLNPTFILVKLGFTGVYIIFVISAQNIDCGYSLEPPRRGGSNEYHNLCFEQKYEKYKNFLPEKLPFFGGKIFSVFE